MLAVVLIVVAAVAIVATWFFVFRRPRQDPGIVGFRKHIDALSPESRREVQERMREQHERDDPPAGPPGPV